ncbi:hypothetical protein E5288_WYG010469 [Bos mutus]|uniref:Uncharacterized protein n=1 Tax=Bos mutus TaxID=72004 RepID=A0A6B0RY34_9CETA|nr:hypothetical protein [Bos mutus]
MPAEEAGPRRLSSLSKTPQEQYKLQFSNQTPKVVDCYLTGLGSHDPLGRTEKPMKQKSAKGRGSFPTPSPPTSSVKGINDTEHILSFGEEAHKIGGEFMVGPGEREMESAQTPCHNPADRTLP